MAIPLPELTQLIVHISMWFADYWWIALPFLSLIFAVVIVATYYIRHRTESYWLSALWTFCLIGVPFTVILVTWECLNLPFVKLAEGLSR